MKYKAVFGIAMSISMLIVFILFIALTDAGQFLGIPRSMFVTTWLYRIPLAAFATLTLGLSWAVWLIKQRTISKLMISASCVWLFCLLNALLLNSHILFEPQANPKETVYLSFSEADKLYDDNEDVVVLVANGQSAAYPKREIRSPHIAGIQLGGEDITFAFCGLSNVGAAFSPGKNNQYYDFGIIGQANNNLIMYDTRTGEPIQQLSGIPESGGERLSEHPTLRMSYGSYKEAFPQGRVYNNTEGMPWYRRAIVNTFFFIAKYFMKQDDMAFPYRYSNDKLTGKTLVYGIGINEDYVAYTVDYLITQGGIVTTVIGEKNVVVAHIQEFNSVAAFYGDGNVTKVDIYGNSNLGVLERLSTLRPKVYWGVWQHYFPNTDLNRG